MIECPPHFAQHAKKHIKYFQNILSLLFKDDENEADTITIVKDILAEVFGYDKYQEITSGYQQQDKYCDIGIRINNKLVMMIEVKAIGMILKSEHLEHAVNYAADNDNNWVILTNGIQWNIYYISSKIDAGIVTEYICSFNLLEDQIDDYLTKIYCLSKPAIKINGLAKLRRYVSIMNEYFITSVLLSDPILTQLKLELKKVYATLNNCTVSNIVQEENIHRVLESKIIKRKIFEADEFMEAQKEFAKYQRILAKENPNVHNQHDQHKQAIVVGIEEIKEIKKEKEMDKEINKEIKNLI